MQAAPAQVEACKVMVAVCTVGAPSGLEACLQSLLRSCANAPHVSIVVIDNVPCDVTKARVHAVHHDIRYVPEPQRGLSQARNAAVAEALNQGVDYLAFVDDDEVVSPQWFAQMHAFAQRTNGDILTAPVHEYFDDTLPEHHPARTLRMFIPKQAITGSECAVAYTGNIWIHARVLRAWSPLFNLGFARTGGEDEHFSRQARARGFRVLWCNDATIHSVIPPQRATLGWLMRRGFRAGSACSMSWRLLHGARGIMRSICYGVFRSMRAGYTLFLALVLWRRATLMEGVFYSAQALGTWCGIMGLGYAEYASKH